jgi:hypothetical protein
MTVDRKGDETFSSSRIHWICYDSLYETLRPYFLKWKRQSFFDSSAAYWEELKEKRMENNDLITTHEISTRNHKEINLIVM